MMPSEIPDIRTDGLFNKSAREYAVETTRAMSIRIDEFHDRICELLSNAYLTGGKAGFEIAWNHKERVDGKEYSKGIATERVNQHDKAITAFCRVCASYGDKVACSYCHKKEQFIEELNK